jgi:hypothetical protein
MAAFGVFLGLLFILNWKYRDALRGGFPRDAATQEKEKERSPDKDVA